MISKEKILDFAPPQFASYPHVAGLCSMLGNNPWLMPEMVNDLVGLVYDRKIDRIDFSISLDILSYMKNYPLLYTHAVSRSFVEKNWKRFSDFVEAAVADGYYVHCLLDTFYVSAYRETYRRDHYLHNAMIYGYNRQRGTVVIADAFEKGKYASSEASYTELNSSFLSTHVGDWLDGILLCKRKEDPFFPAAYHTQYLKKQFAAFRTGTIPACSCAAEIRRREADETRFIHGIRVYDALADYMRESFREDGSFEAVDLRLFYALQDHMKAWRYLAENLLIRNQLTHVDLIFAQCDRLYDRLKNLTMLAVKFNVTGKKSVCEKMIQELLICQNDAAKICRLFETYMEPDFSAVDAEQLRLTRPERINACSVLIHRSREEDWKRRTPEGDIVYSAASGAGLSFQFFGNGICLYVEKNPSYGKADIWIDGRVVKAIDYSAGEPQEQIDGLATGFHSCRIEKKDADGTYINLREVHILTGEPAAGTLSNDKGLETPSKGSRAEGSVQTPYTSARRTAFSKADGDIVITCGKAGRDMTGVGRQLPADMTEANLTYVNAIPVILMNTTAGKRGIRSSAEKKDYAAAYLLNEEFFEVRLTVPGKEKLVTLYFVDYDGMARSMEITVSDTDGCVFDTCLIEEFTSGRMLQYRVCGSVIFHFRKVAGPDAVLSAVLLDD